MLNFDSPSPYCKSPALANDLDQKMHRLQRAWRNDRLFHVLVVLLSK